MRDPKGEEAPLGKRFRGLAKSGALHGISRLPFVDVVWLGQYGDPQRWYKKIAYDPFLTARQESDGEPPRRELREQLGLTDDIRWFAMVGSLSLRKNVPLAAEALSLANESSTSRDAGLLLFGPVSSDLASSADDLRALLPDGLPVVVREGLKTNEQLNDAIIAADAVLVARGLHYPNSTLVKAVALGRPVVFAGTAYSRRRALRLPGVVVAELSLDSISKAVLQAMKIDPGASRPEYNDLHFVTSVLW